MRTKEHNEKIGEAQRRAWARNPSRRLMHSEDLKALWELPSYRRKQTEMLRDNLKKNMANAGFMEQVIKALQESKTPEWRRRRSIAMRGRNNPGWLGGRRRLRGYPDVWYSKKWKEEVRKKLGNKCAVCGVLRSANGNALEVHHKDENKKNCRLENLELLCLLHHRRIHGDRIAARTRRGTE